MFGKKHKDRIVETPIHPVIGEIKYIGIGWEATEKIQLALWRKTYDIPLNFIADSKEDSITENQEIAFEKLKQVIIEQKSEIEKSIISYAKTEDEEELLIRFIPSHIHISKKGECALFVADTDEDGAYNDETETAFALFLMPKLLLYTSEDSLDFLLGGGGSLHDDLYG